MFNFITEFDTSLFLAINNGWQHPFLDAVCPWLRDAKHWIPFYVFLLYLSWRYYGKQVMWIMLGAGILVLISDQFSANLIKNTFERLRPCNDPLLKNKVHLLVNCGQGYSFMSAHATNHFAIAAYFAILFKKQLPGFWLLLLFWASCISISQVYVGVHYPLDIFAGAICGIIFGYVAALLVLRKTEQV